MTANDSTGDPGSPDRPSWSLPDYQATTPPSREPLPPPPIPPEPAPGWSPKHSRWRIIGLPVVLTLVGLVLMTLLWGKIDTTQRLKKVDVGDCTAWPTWNVYQFGLEIWSCDEPHELEVYATGQVDTSNDQATADYCADEFTPYTGQDYATSELDIWYITPSGDDGGLAICMLGMADGSWITGTRHLDG